MVWIAQLSGWEITIFSYPTEINKSNNSISAGVALETGGYVFHLFITNNTRLNPTQYLIGVDNNTNIDAWHFAFGFTMEL